MGISVLKFKKHPALARGNCGSVIIPIFCLKNPTLEVEGGLRGEFNRRKGCDVNAEAAIDVAALATCRWLRRGLRAAAAERSQVW